jgi:hypothetical protein
MSRERSSIFFFVFSVSKSGRGSHRLFEDANNPKIRIPVSEVPHNTVTSTGCSIAALQLRSTVVTISTRNQYPVSCVLSSVSWSYVNVHCPLLPCFKSS